MQVFWKEGASLTRGHVMALVAELAPLGLKPIQCDEGGLGDGKRSVRFNVQKTWPYILHMDATYNFRLFPRVPITSEPLCLTFFGQWKERECHAVYDAFEQLDCTREVKRPQAELWSRRFVDQCALFGVDMEYATRASRIVRSVARNPSLDHASWTASILAVAIHRTFPEQPPPVVDNLASLFGRSSVTAIPLDMLQQAEWQESDAVAH